MQCDLTKVAPVEFGNYYDCIVAGYSYSSTELKRLGRDNVEKKKLAIRFQCKEVKVSNV
jgi:hypothetical protein